MVNGRCRRHGGEATGPRTVTGRARTAEAGRQRGAVNRGEPAPPRLPAMQAVVEYALADMGRRYGRASVALQVKLATLGREGRASRKDAALASDDVLFAYCKRHLQDIDDVLNAMCCLDYVAHAMRPEAPARNRRT